MRKNAILLGIMILLLSLVLWGCSGKVVATVNGENITSAELDQQVEFMKAKLEQQGLVFTGEQGQEFVKMLQKNMLTQLIDHKLLMSEATKRGLIPDDKEVTEEIDAIKEQLGDEGEFKKFLAANGVNETKLKELLKEQLAIQKLQENVLAGLPEPTEEQIKNYYEQNKDSFSQPEQRQVSHILIGVGEASNGQDRSEIDAKVLALQIVAKLQAGGDFAELAKQYSDDPGSKDNGGQYPRFSRGSGFVEEFENASFELKEGEFTVEPVKTDYGYHIIRLDQITPAKTITLAEVKDSIIANLQGEAANKKMEEFMNGLRDNAEIVNKLEKESE